MGDYSAVNELFSATTWIVESSLSPVPIQRRRRRSPSIPPDEGARHLATGTVIYVRPAPSHFTVEQLVAQQHKSWRRIDVSFIIDTYDPSPSSKKTQREAGFLSRMICSRDRVHRSATGTSCCWRRSKNARHGSVLFDGEEKRSAGRRDFPYAAGRRQERTELSFLVSTRSLNAPPAVQDSHPVAIAIATGGDKSTCQKAQVRQSPIRTLFLSGYAFHVKWPVQGELASVLRRFAWPRPRSWGPWSIASVGPCSVCTASRASTAPKQRCFRLCFTMMPLP
jgi:hypothetical protein